MLLFTMAKLNAKLGLRRMNMSGINFKMEFWLNLRKKCLHLFTQFFLELAQLEKKCLHLFMQFFLELAQKILLLTISYRISNYLWSLRPCVEGSWTKICSKPIGMIDSWLNSFMNNNIKQPK